MVLKEIPDKILRKFLKKTFPFWQILGFNITLLHYSEPISDTRKLKDNLWQKQSQLIGINMIERERDCPWVKNTQAIEFSSIDSLLNDERLINEQRSFMVFLQKQDVNKNL